MICYCQEVGGGNLMLRSGGKTTYNPETDPSYLHRELADSITIDSMAIHKEDRLLFAFCHGQLLKMYRIHLGLQPVGAKQSYGDYKTPEGRYYINARNTMSSYHKSLGISCPNENDLLEAKKQGKPPGGDIVLHGLPNGAEELGKNHYRNDWTWGCIALTNSEIDELFQHVNLGTPILVLP